MFVIGVINLLSFGRGMFYPAVFTEADVLENVAEITYMPDGIGDKSRTGLSATH